jgi:hypothetical protein
LQPFVGPLISCYDSILYQGNSIPKQKSIESSHPGRAYLLRIQGYLSDLYDLEEALSYTPTKIPAIDVFGVLNVQTMIREPIMGIVLDEKRRLVINEIISTERTYVDQLLSLHEIYYDPIAKNSILSKKKINVIFGNLIDIISLHKSLLYLLEKLCDNSENLIGEFFVQTIQFFKIYSIYMNNFDDALSFISCLNGTTEKTNIFLNVRNDTMQNYKKFEQIAKSNPKHSQINLAAFLILPIQRLPRYQLLLQSLLVSTRPNHPDLNSTQKAVDRMINIIEFCNENKRIMEKKSSTLIRLNQISISVDSELHFLLNPSPYRSLVHENSALFIVKYVIHEETTGTLEPMILCKQKKSHIRYTKRGPVLEWRFKCTSDNEAKIMRLIEQSGMSARFDVSNYVGKRCQLFLCNDLLIICNSNLVLAGYIELPSHATATCLPLFTGPQCESNEAIMRISNGKCVLYIKGSMEEIVKFVELINSFI